MNQIAIISDIHSNAFALEAALQLIEKKEVNQVICLGDLLTYGCQPNEVIHQLKKLSRVVPTSFIIGNHDQYYFECQSADIPAVEYLRYQHPHLPEFIRESIVWTLRELQFKLIDEFPWQKSKEIDKLFFAHANPFGFGNWHYLNSPEKIIEAAENLRQRQYRVGCFGHTHLSNITQYNADTKTIIETEFARFDLNKNNENSLIINPGSLGQPRGTNTSFILIQQQNSILDLHIVPVQYDTDQQKRLLQNNIMSETTRQHLLSHF